MRQATTPQRLKEPCVSLGQLATFYVVVASNFSDMTVALAVPDVIVARAPAGDEAALEALYRAFDRLSETSRAVVWLHDVEGYTHEEIADQMGKTVSFSKSQLARAHARLRRMLDEGAQA